jgi:hypothetical protein
MPPGRIILSERTRFGKIRGTPRNHHNHAPGIITVRASGRILHVGAKAAHKIRGTARILRFIARYTLDLSNKTSPSHRLI